MAKKRGSIADGVKATYQVHQALEAVQSLTQSKVRQFLEGIGEFVMMMVSLAIVCGLFWLANWAIHALKNSVL
jgi:hypothetical protein